MLPGAWEFGVKYKNDRAGRSVGLRTAGGNQQQKRIQATALSHDG
jgi:hypothetical protein